MFRTARKMSETAPAKLAGAVVGSTVVVVSVLNIVSNTEKDGRAMIRDYDKDDNWVVCKIV